MPKNSLFIEENSRETGAWVSNSAGGTYLYAEGYKLAGNQLYQTCLNDASKNNVLLYPIVFNYRQYVELSLKELITRNYKATKSNKRHRLTHSLEELLEEIEESYTARYPKFEIDSFLPENIKSLILDFNKIDCSSMSFRYPLDRAAASAITMQTIDLKHFKERIDDLVVYLDGMLSNE